MATEVNIDISQIEESLEISRGEKPDVKFDFEQIGETKVIDQHGIEHTFKNLYKNKKTIVIFIRHFLCFVTKEYIDDLALVPEKHFKNADVNLVVIGCGAHKFIKAFRQSTGYRGPLFVDPSRTLYNAIGLYSKHKNDGDPLGKPKQSCHVKSTFLTGLLKSTWRGIQFKEFQGDMNQQGGTLIMGPGDVIHYHHFDVAAYDHAPLNDVLAEAGLPHVNFPRDKRVLTL